MSTPGRDPGSWCSTQSRPRWEADCARLFAPDSLLSSGDTSDVSRPRRGRHYVAMPDGTDKSRVVLAVDVGGPHVKVLLSPGGERRRFPSGPDMTAEQMVKGVLGATKDWDYDVVSVGVPAQVMAGKVAHDPVNLGEGWVGFDFERAFGRPTQVVN